MMIGCKRELGDEMHYRKANDVMQCGKAERAAMPRYNNAVNFTGIQFGQPFITCKSIDRLFFDYSRQCYKYSLTLKCIYI